MFCSAYTGEGLSDVQPHIASLAKEYTDIHFADLEESMKSLTIAKEHAMEQSKERFNNDIS